MLWFSGIKNYELVNTVARHAAVHKISNTNMSLAIHATVHKLSIRNLSASVAWQRKSFQLVVGAVRRRAAPRSQSYGAAHVALRHFIG